MDQKGPSQSQFCGFARGTTGKSLGRSRQSWAGTRQRLGMKKYCLIFNGWVISPQNLMPVCIETECIPMHMPDYTHIYACMHISVSAVANISSKILNLLDLRFCYDWLLLELFLDDVSQILTTGHTFDENKAFIILQWQFLPEQTSIFAPSQHTNPASLSTHFLCVSAWKKSLTSNIIEQNCNFPFLCFKWRLGCNLDLFQQVYYPQIPFPVLLILHMWQVQKSEVIDSAVSDTLLWVWFSRGSIWKRPLQPLIWLLPWGKHCHTKYR